VARKLLKKDSKDEVEEKKEKIQPALNSEKLPGRG